jgi:hypothetical protein
MWRERIFLYDRFYLAPAIRAADRVVLEILQHFLIRSVISTRFADKIRTKNVSLNSENETFQTLAESMEQNSSPIDVRERKYEACRILLEGMTLNFGKMGRRDFDLLAFMEELLNKWPHIDDKYCRFLHSMYLSLTKLREGSDLKKYANDHIVQRPLQFPREYTQDIRELARSLQHQYYQDVLIDVCVLPNVLSSSPFQAPIGSDASKRFMQLLVPKGDVSKWGPGSRNLEPLNPSKVKELELPYGRVMILSENKNLARSKYIFDQLLGAIQSSGIPIEEVE